MANPKRWLTHLTAAAAEAEEVQMPWARGARRMRFIARRSAGTAASRRHIRA